MSVRTGIGIPEFSAYGGLTGSATSVQLNAALDDAWDWFESELSTNIVVAEEAQEVHLWPAEKRDWNQINDRVSLRLTHVTSVEYVHALEYWGGCQCTPTVLSGCAIIIDGEAGLVALRGCAYGATSGCTGGCGGNDSRQARITYLAGLFATGADIPDNFILLVIMKAREALSQITSGDISGMGAIAVTSWHSMDYSESRAGPSKGSTYLDDYIRKRIEKYKVKRAFSLRRTH